MSSKPPESKKRLLDTEASGIEVSAIAQTSSPKVEKEKDFWEPFKKLFNSPEHSDVKLYLGYQKVPFYGHSFVFKIRFPYLGERVSGKKEVYFAEDEEVYTPWRMLEYVYTGDYTAESYANLIKFHKEVNGKLFRHTNLYILAGEYDLRDLQDLCCDKCRKGPREEWDCDSFCSSVAELLDFYSEDQDNMLKVMGDIVLDHASQLLEGDKYLTMLEDRPVSAFFMRKLLSKHCESKASNLSS